MISPYAHRGVSQRMNTMCKEASLHSLQRYTPPRLSVLTCVCSMHMCMPCLYMHASCQTITDWPRQVSACSRCCTIETVCTGGHSPGRSLQLRPNARRRRASYVPQTFPVRYTHIESPSSRLFFSLVSISTDDIGPWLPT